MSETRDPIILRERSGVVALLKPTGLPTQAPAGIPSVEAWLRQRLSPGAYLGIPHRLDRAVSGVLLMATTPRAARQLSRQFERREVTKEYVAIVSVETGASLPAVGGQETWTDRIAKLPGEAKGAIVAADDPAGREAVTVVRGGGALSDHGAAAGPRGLLFLGPRTGRMHQLRIQAASRGLPILGDTLYGGSGCFVDAGGDARTSPIALHAVAVRFRDPDGGEAVEITAPPPGFWPDAARSLAGA